MNTIKSAIEAVATGRQYPYTKFIECTAGILGKEQQVYNTSEVYWLSVSFVSTVAIDHNSTGNGERTYLELATRDLMCKIHEAPLVGVRKVRQALLQGDRLKALGELQKLEHLMEGLIDEI